MLITLVSFFLILIVLILVHELGHFFTAKLFKVRVEEFGIFLPPRIFSFKKGDTIYSLNAIPLGGFNKLAGEEDPAVPGSLAGKSIPVRLAVLGAGSLMNILLPVILLSIAFMIPHLESVSINSTDKAQVFVMEVVANSTSIRSVPAETSEADTRTSACPAAGVGVGTSSTAVRPVFMFWRSCFIGWLRRE